MKGVGLVDKSEEAMEIVIVSLTVMHHTPNSVRAPE